jgi:aryl-alcohol dehydrogenase-like predicted oxidoreductase
MTMRTHAIGGQGLTASVEGLGTMGMTALYGTRDDTESVATVHRALDLGVTLFDTADMYGSGAGEELLGHALRDRRDQAIISTKVGGVILDDAGQIVGGPNGHPDYVRKKQSKHHCAGSAPTVLTCSTCTGSIPRCRSRSLSVPSASSSTKARCAT